MAEIEPRYSRDIAEIGAQLARARAAPCRLQHPHFGLDTFFVSQNAGQKLTIRLIPSVRATLAAGRTPSPFMAFAIAALIRYLTPRGPQPRISDNPPVFNGHLDLPDTHDTPSARWEYALGLHVDPAMGTYEFTDADGVIPRRLRQLGCDTNTADDSVVATGDVLQMVGGLRPRDCASHAAFAVAVGTLLDRMIRGECALDVLRTLVDTTAPSPNQPNLPTHCRVGHKLVETAPPLGCQQVPPEKSACPTPLPEAPSSPLGQSPP